MVKLIDKYLIKELIGPFLLGIFGFTIFMIGDLLISQREFIIGKKMPVFLLIKWLSYNVPAMIVWSFPCAMLFSALFSIGRLQRDNELLIIRISSISFYRLILPLFIIGIITSIVAFIINEKVVPWSNHQSQKIIRQLIFTSDLPTIQEEIFFKGGEDTHFYIKRYNPQLRQAQGICIYETIEDFPEFTVAKFGSFHENFWILTDGVKHKLDKDGSHLYELKFTQLKITTNFDLLDFLVEQRTPQEMSAKQLLAQIKMFEKSGIETARLKTDYHFKFSIPFACCIVILIATPLSLITGKSGYGIIILISVLFAFFTYYPLTLISSYIGYEGLTSPALAAWLPNIIYAIIGGILIWKVEH